MKRFSGTISLLFAMAVFILGGSAKAAAQENLRITVPFAFTANHQYLPAGAYSVNWLSDHYMVLRNVQSGEAQVLIVRPEDGPIIETQGRFVFVQEGNRYYLARVCVAGRSLHSEMTVQHRPESAAQLTKAPAPKTVEVAAK